jgi:hypothetical protein
LIHTVSEGSISSFTNQCGIIIHKGPLKINGL